MYCAFFSQGWIKLAGHSFISKSLVRRIQLDMMKESSRTRSLFSHLANDYRRIFDFLTCSSASQITRSRRLFHESPIQHKSREARWSSQDERETNRTASEDWNEQHAQSFNRDVGQEISSRECSTSCLPRQMSTDLDNSIVKPIDQTDVTREFRGEQENIADTFDFEVPALG